MVVRSLGKCGCCEGLKAQTPQEIYNRPGLSSIKYRSGNHSLFKESLIAALSDTELFSEQELKTIRGLKTREDDDFSIALLDAWAAVSDVLTFYQERIANECYLRTATESESLLQLARLIGYKPRPGVAASTSLAFFMETAKGAPESTLIESGMKVQSIPGPGETPCVFETVERIEARPLHNELRPRLSQRHPLNKGRNPFYLQGTATSLRPGDGIFVNPGDGDPYFCLVAMVNPVPLENKTEVWLQPPLEIKIEMKKISDRDRQKQNKKAMEPETKGLVQADLGTRAGETVYINESDMALSSPVQAARRGKFVKSADYNAFAIMKGTTPAKMFADHAYVARKREKERELVFRKSLINASSIEILPIEPSPTKPLPIKTLPIGAVAFRIRANIFGHNAPRFDTLPSSLTFGTKSPYHRRKDSWVDTNLSEYYLNGNDQRNSIFLDSSYDIARGSLVLLRDKNYYNIFHAIDVISESKSDFTLTSRITILKLQPFEGDISKRNISYQNILNQFMVRETQVFSGGESLLLSDVPYIESVTSDHIELDGHVDGLRVGQTVIVCGQLNIEGKQGTPGCEWVTISLVEHLDQPGGFTTIFLKEGLKNSYLVDTVKIYANVALATAGESKAEVLGSGDSSLAFQRFHLLNSPLTYVSAQNSQGARSTLQVYVDGVQWQEVPSLFDKGPNDRVYTVQIEPEGKTTVLFGDGRNGARLPTGQENIKAVYRKGLGSGGNVAADKISLLMSMPLGLRSVTNPQAALGGSDPEDQENARLNMPLGIITLDRLVSLQDYEDFARAFAGIGKALATWTWNGRVRGVFVTIAGPLGETIDKDSQVYENLRGEMQRQGDPFVPVDLGSYSKVFFRIAASIKIETSHETEQVISEVRSRVVSSFSFRGRSFGQPVNLSEVIGLIKSVPGVTAVDVSKLYKVGETSKEDLNQRLSASQPRSGQEAAEVQGAELLTLDPLQPFDSLGVMF